MMLLTGDEIIFYYLQIIIVILLPLENGTVPAKAQSQNPVIFNFFAENPSKHGL